MEDRLDHQYRERNRSESRDCSYRSRHDRSQSSNRDKLPGSSRYEYSI